MALALIITILLCCASVLTAAVIQSYRVRLWKKAHDEMDEECKSWMEKLEAEQKSSDQILTTLVTLGLWPATVRRPDLLPQAVLDRYTDDITKAVSEMRSNACSDELRAELESAIATAREADQAREEAEKILHKYRTEFIPSVMSERDTWNRMYMDAVVTYGNAQDRYERAIDYLARRAKVEFPKDVRVVMDANKAKAEKGKATPKAPRPDGDHLPVPSR